MAVSYLDERALSAQQEVPGAESAQRVPVPQLPAYWRARSWPLIQQDPEQDDAAIVTFLWSAPDVHTVLLVLEGLTEEHRTERSEMEYLGDGVFAMSFRVPRGWKAAYSFYPCAGVCLPPWRAQSDCPLESLVDRSAFDPKNPQRCCDAAGRNLSLVEVPVENGQLESQPLAA